MSNKTGDTSYPVSKQFNMHFSPYEDRLIVRAQRSDGSDVYMLLTRRMVMLILQQMLAKLPKYCRWRIRRRWRRKPRLTRCWQTRR